MTILDCTPDRIIKRLYNYIWEALSSQSALQFVFSSHLLQLCGQGILPRGTNKRRAVLLSAPQYGSFQVVTPRRYSTLRYRCVCSDANVCLCARNEPLKRLKPLFLESALASQAALTFLRNSWYAHSWISRSHVGKYTHQLQEIAGDTASEDDVSKAKQVLAEAKKLQSED